MIYLSTIFTDMSFGCRAGDVILANYCMAHTIAPNISPYIRYSVYFRITSTAHRSKENKTNSPRPRQPPSAYGGGRDEGLPSAYSGRSASDMKHRPESMLDVWADWPGLRQHIRKASKHAVEAPRATVMGPAAGVAVATAAPVPMGVSVASTSASATFTSSSDVTCEDEENRQLALALERSKYDM